ncbi:plasmid recombination protein [Pontibacter sp. E15-1]|uniref:MobV family relaxase n=1 Tax=Pontibacter sp. E15-1 TaxID=2919918 RepID=UPI001F4F21E5|nr:MobV family relaxase [Pontibacter sp. E15-1]MCJ8167655.1 plasmid recombination protein [Pontibacter sp. E15-1]
MGFAVFHPSKGSGTGGGSGHHIDRTPGHEHTYAHTDPARRELNINHPLQGDWHKITLPEAINRRIEQGYQGKKAIRKDAVKFLSLVLTGSHEDMAELASDPARFKKWQQANYDFVAKEFGEGNIMRFVLHMDEKTPHLHAIVVPLTEDGRLSAKEIMGNKKSLSLRQDRYAEAVQPFGLTRGVRDSKARHTGEGWYLEHLKESHQSQNKATVPTFGLKEALRPAKYLEDVKTSLIALQQQNSDLQLDNRRRVNQVKDAQASRQKTEADAAKQKQATQSIAEQLIQAGQAGVTLNAAYALLEAPQAVKEAANAIFQQEVRKLADAQLKPITEGYYREIYQLHDSSKATKKDYERHQKYDSTETRETIAKEAIKIFNLEVQQRWGVELNPETSLHQDLRKKARDFVRELARSIVQEVKQALGIDKPRQQSRRTGM